MQQNSGTIPMYMQQKDLWLVQLQRGSKRHKILHFAFCVEYQMFCICICIVRAATPIPRDWISLFHFPCFHNVLCRRPPPKHFPDFCPSCNSKTNETLNSPNNQCIASCRKVCIILCFSAITMYRGPTYEWVSKSKSKGACFWGMLILQTIYY